MAYNSANFNMMAETPGGTRRWWSYDAGADAQAAIRVANFFSDAHLKGAKAGDLLLVTYASFAGSIHVFNSVGASANDLTDGLAVAATDTD
jgi:hypothetical protein